MKLYCKFSIIAAILSVLAFFCNIGTAFSQQVGFAYDAAGNRIKREIIISNYIFTVGIPSLISAEQSHMVKDGEGNDCSSHDLHWFELDASRKGARHFDRKYGQGKGDNYFDYNSFVLGDSSQYINPRTGQVNSDAKPVSYSLLRGRKPWWF